MAGRTAFGIDLSGYTTGRSVCAEATTADEQEACVRIIHRCPLAISRKTSADLAPVAKDEIAFLKAMMSGGREVAVDVPIDLQGLPVRPSIAKVWELTLRPIDRALQALPPLADKIGAPTARFQNLIRTGGLESRIGETLFETYPAASLRNLGMSRSDLMTKWESECEELNEDEVDAAVCAVTALATDRLEGDSLTRSLVDEFDRRAMERRDLPRGYILLASLPFRHVRICRIDAEIWTP